MICSKFSINGRLALNSVNDLNKFHTIAKYFNILIKITLNKSIALYFNIKLEWIIKWKPS